MWLLTHAISCSKSFNVLCFFSTPFFLGESECKDTTFFHSDKYFFRRYRKILRYPPVNQRENYENIFSCGVDLGHFDGLCGFIWGRLGGFLWVVLGDVLLISQYYTVNQLYTAYRETGWGCLYIVICVGVWRGVRWGCIRFDSSPYQVRTWRCRWFGVGFNINLSYFCVVLWFWMFVFE